MTKNPKVTRAIVDGRRRKPDFFVPESLNITTQYFRDLNKMIVEKMNRLIRERIYPVLEKYGLRFARTDSGTRGFQVVDDDLGLELVNAYKGIEEEFENLQRVATIIATNRMTQANNANRRAFVSSWNKAVGVNVSPLLSKPVRLGGRLIDNDSFIPVREAIAENVRLIKTIPEQQLQKVQATIEKGLTTGRDSFTLEGLIDELEVVGKQTKNRAKLIARDQLQKVNSVLVQARQQSIGVNGYFWRTSNDERVRETHRDNNGKRFQWDSPPATGHPGEDINCRCVAEPDLSQIIPSLAPELDKIGPKRRNRISI